MNHFLLKKEVQDYIKANLKSDVTKILLNPPNFECVLANELVGQIKAKSKAQHKLPTWFKTENIYYPQPLSIEQASSEESAAYKASLVKGEHILDASMGFGIDAYYFSKAFEKVTGCEINSELAEIVKHNASRLKIDNLVIHDGDAIAYLSGPKKKFDCIYIDPSRRDKDKKRVFRFSDCEPDIVENLELLLGKSQEIMIKSSPLIDLNLGINELKQVAEIHIVAIRNEVKDLLWVIRKGTVDQVKVTAVNLGTNERNFSFNISEEPLASPSFGLPQSYLYEPNAAILKSGAFKLISDQFNINKLHQHTHLYTGDKLIEFPGRRFKVTDVLDFNKKILKRHLPKKANVSTRNFPITVADLRKKLKISDGGDVYVFFTTNIKDNKIVLLCEKA